MVFPKSEFNKKSCRDANINKQLLAEMFERIEKEKYNIHSMILLHEGSLVFNAYAHNFSENTTSNVYSVSKSFLSVAIGILVDLKLLDLDNPVLFYFTQDIDSYLPEYEELKISHLLTMTVGQEKDEFIDIDPNCNPFKKFFNIPLKNKPGEAFLYNNFASFILSVIVTKVTGKSVNDFLNEKLYKIIQIEKPFWDGYKQYSLGCTGLRITLNDMVRFGHLILNDGKWEDSQIVSKEYLDKATDKHVAEPSSPLFYGYHFWVGKFVMAAGLYKQYVVVDKRYNIVFAMQAYEEREVIEIYYNYIVKAMERGWEISNISLREYVRNFQINSQKLIEKELNERTN
jgi:CubicO group peptidase (beta-lactamase class C family)